MSNATITFEIVECCGIINTSENGWSLELNKVSWNGRPPKWDVRSWSPNHERMSRGMTFTDDEMKALMALYSKETEE